jgi:hypothetical protein
MGTGGAACGAAPRPRLDLVDVMPRVLQEVRPEYPETELRRLQGGTVQLRAEITEHGTITDLQWNAGVEDRNLVAAAKARPPVALPRGVAARCARPWSRTGLRDQRWSRPARGGQSPASAARR